MNAYALYYYQKAAHCKPNDSRMWSALSSVYFQVGELENAITSLKNAYQLDPQDSSIALKLAKLYLKDNKSDDAMYVYAGLLTNDSFVMIFYLY